MDWKQAAEKLYFDQGYTLTQISHQMGVSVASVSKHLNTLPGYQAEKLNRQAKNQDRTAYYRNQKRAKRAQQRYQTVTTETIKHEHHIASLVLSKERFFYE